VSDDAGIAGAATARKLAEHGVRVTVLEAGKAAQAGSGNRQGLLYAKISPHNTEQTELLLTGYGYTRRLLEDLLPDSDVWGGDGVLHLNFDDSERKRNQALGLQHQHKHLYRRVSAEEAAHIAGIDVFSDGLYWPQGVWLNPPAAVPAFAQAQTSIQLTGSVDVAVESLNKDANSSGKSDLQINDGIWGGSRVGIVGSVSSRCPLGIRLRSGRVSVLSAFSAFSAFSVFNVFSVRSVVSIRSAL